MASYEQERVFVESMLKLADIVAHRIADPKAEFGEEIGVDVLCVVGGRTVGVQVTVYNADHGLPSPSPRSSRAEEKSLAKKRPRGYGFSASAEYIAALKHALKGKLAKTFSSVSEGWLLIVAQDPNYGSTSSTFIAADSVSVKRMNEALHPLLAEKQFARVYLLLALERVLFEWRPESKWELRQDLRQPTDPVHIRALREKLFPSRSRT
jgi:hypothetical protein